jgi:hypothetical protein
MIEEILMKKRVLLKGIVILAAISALFFAGCKTKEEGGLPHEAPQWLVGTWKGKSQMTTDVVFSIDAGLGFECTMKFKPDVLGSGTGEPSATVTGVLSYAGLYLNEYMMLNMQADAGAPPRVKSGLAGFNGMKAKLIPNASQDGFAFVAFSVPGGLTTLANQFFGGNYTKQ